MINLETLTLKQMWVLTGAMTIATGIIYLILKDRFKLGFKAILSWKAETVEKLHNEHGSFKVIISTFLLGLGAIHIMHLLVVWLGTILWTAGVWSPSL